MSFNMKLSSDKSPISQMEITLKNVDHSKKIIVDNLKINYPKWWCSD
jgi:hypothetical protein